jgi:hypothetical protein
MVFDSIMITISLAFAGLGLFCIYFFRPRVVEELVLGGTCIALGYAFGISTVGLEKTSAAFGLLLVFAVCVAVTWLNLCYKNSVRGQGGWQ